MGAFSGAYDNNLRMDISGLYPYVYDGWRRWEIFSDIRVRYDLLASVSASLRAYYFYAQYESKFSLLAEIAIGEMHRYIGAYWGDRNIIFARVSPSLNDGIRSVLNDGFLVASHGKWFRLFERGSFGYQLSFSMGSETGIPAENDIFEPRIVRKISFRGTGNDLAQILFFNRFTGNTISVHIDSTWYLFSLLDIDFYVPLFADIEYRSWHPHIASGYDTFSIGSGVRLVPLRFGGNGFAFRVDVSCGYSSIAGFYPTVMLYLNDSF